MRQFIQSLLGRNWKTTGMGLAAVCSAIGDITHSITAHQPVNWNVDVPALCGGIGLLLAKDSSNHSNLDEVKASSIDTPISK